MISAQFLWSMCLSFIMIIRIIITLLTNQTFPLVAFALDYIKVVSSYAIALCIIEYTFFEHWVKLIRKRVPENDHDFLATWFQIVNAAIAIYFGTIQFFGKWHEDSYSSRKLR